MLAVRGFWAEPGDPDRGGGNGPAPDSGLPLFYRGTPQGRGIGGMPRQAPKHGALRRFPERHRALADRSATPPPVTRGAVLFS